jgi:diguanylate cyclase (GGDEF)-like protein
MVQASPSRERLSAAIKLAWLTLALWTAAVACSLAWNLHSSKRKTLDMAYAEAGAVRDKDMAFRRWGLKHSGIYVPATEQEPPSPYLAHLPDRDLKTIDGKRLTLRAPATMVREMMDDYASTSDRVRGRIVGLRALNPANLPDDWEKVQLEAFEMGERDEVWEIAEMNGTAHLRYLKAWYMVEGCVRCHGILGYKAGDMRGATGVSLPLAPYYQRIDEVARNLTLTHGGIWLLGLIGIGWAGREAQQRTRERQIALARFEHLARHDSLTGLANRFSLEERLDQVLSTARREKSPLALMLIDLDRFKNINDTLGHPVGDKLLIDVANRLRYSVRESDIVARLGGDEFVVVLTGIATPQDAMSVAAKMLETLGQPYQVENYTLHSTPSIGISLFPDDGEDSETLLKQADSAMYHAKESGRNRLQFFAAELTAAAAVRMELERDLRAALAADQLDLHFQPQMCSDTEKLCGFEALARWQHPTRGWVPPLQFIPIAEESGLIEHLGAWVLDRACRQLAEWHAAGAAGIRMAVNLSAHQLRSETLVDQVRETLSRHGLDARYLEIEVTESVAMADPEQAILQLHTLRALGVQIAIDDFGTGYSSLAYLKLLPIQTLKLDQSFVRDIETDSNDATISKATLALAHSLGLQVVAEGVETAAQRDFLSSNGCDYLQGYFFGRPASATDCRQFLGLNKA